MLIKHINFADFLFEVKDGGDLLGGDGDYTEMDLILKVCFYIVKGLNKDLGIHYKCQSAEYKREAVNHSYTETNPELPGDGANKDYLPTMGSEWSNSNPSPLPYSPPRSFPSEKRRSQNEITNAKFSNNTLLPPQQPPYSSPLAHHVSTPPITRQHLSFRVSLEQRRASANEAIFESPIIKQVDQLLHEEMNREIDYGIILKKQQEDVEPDSRKKNKKSRPVINFFKSLKNAFHSLTSSTSVSPTGSPTIQPSPMRNTHLPRPPIPEKSRPLSFDSHAFKSLVYEMGKNVNNDENISIYAKRLLHVIQEKHETLRSYYQK
ncbi:kinase-like domain-containing protein [Rhizophagus clarus]|uniref:Kinase-like domain-containing protein n=1 Tax=Rhizophagus clarus TaxID=94130 RepID=A0A8H3LU51_9GLOM|nr:kinase-like domain-containing protein [Rhizophagus clarus]